MAFVSLMIIKFTNSLIKSRPLKEIGAEQVRDAVLRLAGSVCLYEYLLELNDQVLIDLQALKASLLRFPQGMEASALSATYVTFCRLQISPTLRHNN